MARWRPYLLLTFAGAGWGFAFPLAKAVMAETSALHMITLRLWIAALAALPFALGSPRARALFRSPRAWMAGVLYGGPYVTQFAGFAHVSVSLAALLVGLMPAMIAAGSRLWGERVTRGAWAGVAAATLGGVVIGLRSGPAAGDPGGIAVITGSLALFVGYIWAVRGLTVPGEPLAAPAVVLAIGALTAAAMTVPVAGPPSLALSPRGWAALVALSLPCTAMATAAWQIGATEASSATAGVFINLEPVVGAVCGVLVFGDRPTAPLLAGGVLIVAGSLATVVLGRPAAETVRAAPE